VTWYSVKAQGQLYLCLLSNTHTCWK